MLPTTELLTAWSQRVLAMRSLAQPWQSLQVHFSPVLPTGLCISHGCPDAVCGAPSWCGAQQDSNGDVFGNAGALDALKAAAVAPALALIPNDAFKMEAKRYVAWMHCPDGCGRFSTLNLTT